MNAYFLTKISLSESCLLMLGFWGGLFNYLKSFHFPFYDLDTGSSWSLLIAASCRLQLVSFGFSLFLTVVVGMRVHHAPLGSDLLTLGPLPGSTIWIGLGGLVFLEEVHHSVWGFENHDPSLIHSLFQTWGFRCELSRLSASSSATICTGCHTSLSWWRRYLIPLELEVQIKSSF